jgi:hypothetical protein
MSDSKVEVDVGELQSYFHFCKFSSGSGSKLGLDLGSGSGSGSGLGSGSGWLNNKFFKPAVVMR